MVENAPNDVIMVSGLGAVHCSSRKSEVRTGESGGTANR
jgi:hypothetical protein